MLKYKTFISKYSKYNYKPQTDSNWINEFKSKDSQIDKFFIYNLLSTGNLNLQSQNDQILLKHFFISDFYSNYFKLKGKSIINFPFNTIPTVDPTGAHQSNYEHTRKKYLHNLFKFLLENKFIYNKIEKNTENNSSSIKSTNPLEKVCYYLAINNSKFLEQIEKSNEECRLSKQPFKWSNHILNLHEKILNKKLDVKINFEFRDESVKGREKVMEIFIKVDHPEYLFGTSFICIKSDGEHYNKLSLDEKKRKESKTSYRLETRLFAINPINNEKIPILVLDSKHKIASEIDSELRVCIPGHNEIDYRLAKEFSFPIKFVVQPISQMASTLSKQIKQPDDLEEIIKIKSSTLEEIKKNLKSNSTNGPVILKDNEGFLTGCKEFDYLYLKEAKELIVKNLISKRKAIYERRFEIKDLLIGYKNNPSNFNESCTDTNILFTPTYELSANFIFLINQEGQENFPVNLEILKKVFPLDLLINIYQKNTSEHLVTDVPLNENITEILFYSRIFYLILLDILNANKRVDIWKESDIKQNSDEVVLNPFDENRGDSIYTEPFKEILEIPVEDTDNLEIPHHVFPNEKLDDSIRFFYYLRIKGINDYKKQKESNKKFFENLSDIHDIVINVLKNYKFDIDKVRDEKLILNRKSNKNLVVEINKKIIDILNHIETNKNKLNISAEKMVKLIDQIIENEKLIQEYPNYFVFLYFNYLILLYPFCPDLSNSLYQEVRQYSNNSFKKENLIEFSISKVEDTCKFFIEMICNTLSLTVFIDSKQIGNIIIRKLDLNNEQFIKELILEQFNLDKAVVNKINEIEIKDEVILITTR